METYELKVEVFASSISRWWEERSRNKDWLGRALDNMAFSGHYEETTHFFRLPETELIVSGLKHTGLLYCPGFRGYRIEIWTTERCVIVVEMECEFEKREAVNEALDKWPYSPCVVNGYSERERMVQDRIQRFFGSTAFVFKRDREYMLGFPSD
ncbi:MAG: hypothetical protein ACOYS2_03515 [Patescibacteria group bacterium]